jgi:hypothetical protein
VIGYLIAKLNVRITTQVPDKTMACHRLPQLISLEKVSLHKTESRVVPVLDEGVATSGG